MSVGARTPAPPGPGGATGVTRRVHATLATDLTLRRVEVAHAPRVALDFHFERGARPGEAPGALTLTLLTPERVPLAEHDIRPRDERGSLLSRELGRLGTELGTVAEVSGSVDLVLDAGSSGESAGTATMMRTGLLVTFEYFSSPRETTSLAVSSTQSRPVMPMSNSPSAT